MTLFFLAEPAEALYIEAINKYFNATLDPLTVAKTRTAFLKD